MKVVFFGLFLISSFSASAGYCRKEYKECKASETENAKEFCRNGLSFTNGTLQGLWGTEGIDPDENKGKYNKCVRYKKNAYIEIVCEPRLEECRGKY